jgi:hypothetical protein
MASSTEALQKLGRWKKSSTVLRLTVFTKNELPDKYVGVVAAIDEERLWVRFVEVPSREALTLTFMGADFEIGKESLEARRGEEDAVTFVDTGKKLPRTSRLN